MIAKHGMNPIEFLNTDDHFVRFTMQKIAEVAEREDRRRLEFLANRIASEVSKLFGSK